MNIVRARAEDAAQLSAIAWTAKRHWGYPAPWMESWRESLTIRPEFIVSHDTFLCRVDDRCVGFYAVVNQDRSRRLEHLWVLPEATRRGVGRQLFTHAVEQARASGFQSLEIESDPNAEGFYKRMGARWLRANVTEFHGQRRELPILVYEIDQLIMPSERQRGQADGYKDKCPSASNP